MADADIVFLPLGAIIQRFRVGGLNLVQGFPTTEQYAALNEPHFGETIGRVANRVSGAQLNQVNGQTYALAANNGPNTLHGGRVGWGNRTWTGPTPVRVKTTVPGLDGGPLAGGESVRFTLESPHGEENFPGTVQASVVYTAGKQTIKGAEATVLAIEYEATLVDGADETVINMTNHSYFNLTGGPTIEGTVVELATNTYLPVDGGGIPTGGPTAFAAVATTTPFTLGADAPDIDDCFVVQAQPAAVPVDTRGEPLRRLAAAHHPQSGIHLEVFSTEPAFQFYTGKYINLPAVEGAPARGPRSGFCVEPSRYVNAPNVEAWKSMVLVKKGQTYGARIVYRAWKE